MTFLFYPAALAENRLDKYRNNDREKYAVNRSDLPNIIIKAIERIPLPFPPSSPRRASDIYIFHKFISRRYL